TTAAAAADMIGLNCNALATRRALRPARFAWRRESARAPDAAAPRRRRRDGDSGPRVVTASRSDMQRSLSKGHAARGAAQLRGPPAEPRIGSRSTPSAGHAADVIVRVRSGTARAHGAG